MESATEIESPKRKRRIRVIYILLSTPVALVLLVSVAYAVYQASLERQIAAELQKARDRGEPVTIAELEASYYSLPPGAIDQTEQWQRVMKQVSTVVADPAYRDLPIVGKGDADEIPNPGEVWNDEPLVAQIMADLEPSFAELQELVENPGEARFPHKFEDGLFMFLPEVDQLRKVSHVLMLRAHWQLLKGDSESALRSLLAIRGTANMLRAEPIAITQQVRIAIILDMIEAMLWSLPHANWSDLQLVRLQRKMQLNQGYLQAQKVAFVGERVIGQQVYLDPQAISDAGGHDPVEHWFQRADHLFFLQLMSRVMETVEQPPAVAEAQFESIGHSITDRSALARAQTPLVNKIFPAFEGVHSATYLAISADRMAAILLACQRYHNQHGSYPPQLSDLTLEFLEAISLDPFTGQPLQYRVSETEVVVYSVGPNLTDDGGLLSEGNVDWENDYAVGIVLSE